jgi:hypothetical protein
MAFRRLFESLVGPADYHCVNPNSQPKVNIVALYDGCYPTL